MRQDIRCFLIGQSLLFLLIFLLILFLATSYSEYFIGELIISFFDLHDMTFLGDF
jgi:hypothetical protein